MLKRILNQIFTPNNRDHNGKTFLVLIFKNLGVKTISKIFQIVTTNDVKYS